MPRPLDIPLQRNEDYAATWKLADETGTAIDLTGWSFSLDIRDPLNNATLIASGVVSIPDPVGGEVQIKIYGADLASYGNALHPASLPYDVLAEDVGGLKTALVRGDILLARGVSA